MSLFFGFRSSSLLVIILVLNFSCRSIPKYSDAGIEPEIKDVLVTRFPSPGIQEYDNSIYVSWIRIFNLSAQIKREIDIEIDRRQKRLLSKRIFLGAIGGLTSLASTIIAVAISTPSSEVLAILGIFSTTSFTGSMAFFNNDERATYLTAKSRRIDELRQTAELELSILENKHVELSLLINQGKKDIMDEDGNRQVPDTEVVEKYKELETQITKLRTALSNWASELK